MDEQGDGNEELDLAKRVEEISDEKDKLEDTLIKANKTITNLFRKDPMLYPDIAKEAIIRTLTLEKLNAEVEAREFLEVAHAFKRMLMLIHQEVVDVEKVDPNNLLAQKVRRILGSPDDFPEKNESKN